jgi:hypothetical protein
VTDQPKIRRSGNDYVEWDGERWQKRRRQKNTAQRLYENDRIGDEEFRACVWYNRQYEASTFGVRYTLTNADQILKDKDQRAGRADYTPSGLIDADKALKEVDRELGDHAPLIREIVGMEKTTRWVGDSLGEHKDTVQSKLLKAIHALREYCQQRGYI